MVLEKVLLLELLVLSLLLIRVMLKLPEIMPEFGQRRGRLCHDAGFKLLKGGIVLIC